MIRHFHVAPRYTSGSPAMVRWDIAQRVALQEVDAYKRLIENPHMIPSETERAQREGLQGIAYATDQRSGRIEVSDMITGEFFKVPGRLWEGHHWHSRTDRGQFRQARPIGQSESLAQKVLGSLCPFEAQSLDRIWNEEVK